MWIQTHMTFFPPGKKKKGDVLNDVQAAVFQILQVYCDQGCQTPKGTVVHTTRKYYYIIYIF